ncbi:hypothetical protein CUMW_250590 [Citrus unshiu]|uniref:Cytochrome P450 n=1 Tax=Citrus unshiu TaxID=55188 RepID=A0A2H5QPX2_CITUN|nr:hypothetical protein CUMW_250590 [Citrus unshiu]
MAELLHNPEALSKLKLVNKQIVGKGKTSLNWLPYLQVVVKETFRLHPPIPLLLSRKASEDGEIIGFIVPKGARVLSMLGY